MNSKHTFIRAVIPALAVILTAASCEKEEKVQPNAAEKRTFDSWIQVNYPGATPTSLGARILSETEGTGSTWNGTRDFVIADYTIRNLSGIISEYTSEATAKQLGTYKESNYYGPKVINMAKGATFAGLRDAVLGMKKGGTRQIAIPSWLMTYSVFDTPEEYLKQSTNFATAIYEITLVDYTDDILKYQVERQLTPFVAANMHGVDSTYYGGDTKGLKYGFYIDKTVTHADAKDIPADSTIYINYTGRLLNGQVFDTTVEDTAKVYKIYSPSKKYGPVEVTKGASYDKTTMSSSSVIRGFGAAIYMMKPYEKAVTAFISPLGYGYSGSGTIIPGYAPLSFEIELVDKPKS